MAEVDDTRPIKMIASTAQLKWSIKEKILAKGNHATTHKYDVRFQKGFSVMSAYDGFTEGWQWRIGLDGGKN